MPFGISGGSIFMRVVPDTSGFSAALRAGISGQVSAAEKGLGGTVKRLGSTLTRSISLPLALVGGVATKMAIDFEGAFTRISAISNASAKDITEWRQDVLDLAGETARAPQELAEALYFLASAGLKSGQVMKVLEFSAKASASGLGETQDIARLLAQTLNAYAKSGLSAKHATDILVAAVKEGTAEPQEFADAMGRILPIASRAGVSFDQVAGSLAGLSNIGLDVNEGVTAMRGVLQALVAPGSQAADALKDVGLSANQLRQVLREDGILGALTLLEKRTGGNIDTLRKIIPNIRALTGELGLTGENAKTVARIFDNVTHSSGSMGDAFDETQKGPAFKMQQALTQLKVSAITLGEKLIPIATKIAGIIGRVADAFSDLSPAAQDNIVKFGLLAIAAGPVIRIIGGLIGTFSKLRLAMIGTSVAKDALAGNMTGTLLPAVAGVSGAVLALTAAVGYAVGVMHEGQDGHKAYARSAALNNETITNLAKNVQTGAMSFETMRLTVKAMNESSAKAGTALIDVNDVLERVQATSKNTAAAVSLVTFQLTTIPRKKRIDFIADTAKAMGDVIAYRALLYSLPSTVDTSLNVVPRGGTRNISGGATGGVFAAAHGAVVAAGGHTFHAGEGAYMTPVGRGGELVNERGVMPLSDEVLDRVAAALEQRMDTAGIERAIRRGMAGVVLQQDGFVVGRVRQRRAIAERGG